MEIIGKFPDPYIEVEDNGARGGRKKKIAVVESNAI